jgi:8-oxo-dGTP pyrophosphatase MutT (NUDIX family)
VTGWRGGYTRSWVLVRSEYEQFLSDGHAAAVIRDLRRAHVTGSAFVFTPDLQKILLGFHKKAGFWIQLGGHVETTDDSVRATARREAQEEGGIADLTDIGNGPLDLDRHELGSGFLRCDTHWDIGYGFLATGTPIASDESESVEWWPVDHLPDNVPTNFDVRLRRAVNYVRH